MQKITEKDMAIFLERIGESENIELEPTIGTPHWEYVSMFPDGYSGFHIMNREIPIGAELTGFKFSKSFRKYIKKANKLPKEERQAVALIKLKKAIKKLPSKK